MPGVVGEVTEYTTIRCTFSRTASGGKLPRRDLWAEMSHKVVTYYADGYVGVRQEFLT